MGLLDDVGKALKTVEEEVKKANTGQQSPAADTARSPAQPAQTPAGRSVTRTHHPGYAKIAAWMKRNYKDQISGSGGVQQGLLLDQITAEACSGLPAKAKKGFMEYLKKQNYEPLLK